MRMDSMKSRFMKRPTSALLPLGGTLARYATPASAGSDGTRRYLQGGEESKECELHCCG